MRKISLILLAAFLLTQLSYSQEEQQNTSKKEIKVNPASKARIKFLEDYWDFGSIPLDAVVTHDFPIKNEGTDTLVITEIKPTCGCTTAPLESNKIAPGEIENLHVQLNTHKLNGLVRKFINIDCNDPINPYLRISFKAVINDPKQIIVPVPNTARFGKVLKGEGKDVTLEIRNGGDSEMTLDLLSMPNEDIVTTEIGKNELKPGDSTEVRFVLTKKAPPGPVAQSLTLESKDNPGTRITIPITGTVVE